MGCEFVLILGYFVLLVTDEVEPNMTAVAVHRNVVGYIGVRFAPQVLRVSQHDIATGQVHVTVESHRFSDDNSAHRRPSQPALHACVVNPSIATASWSTSDTSRRTDVVACSLLPAVYNSSQSTDRPEVASIYYVTVRGVLIGRSAVRFYVTKTSTQTAAAGMMVNRHNQTTHTTDTDDAVVTPGSSQNHVTTAQVKSVGAADNMMTQYNANASYARVVCSLSANVTECRHVSYMQATANYDVSVTVQRWWLADECKIVVLSPVRQTTVDVLCYVLIMLTAVNLVGIGGQLDCDEATQLLRRPSPLAVGLFCRFALTPTVGLHHVHSYLSFRYSRTFDALERYGLWDMATRCFKMAYFAFGKH